LSRALNETLSESYGISLAYVTTQCYLSPDTSEHTLP